MTTVEDGGGGGGWMVPVDPTSPPAFSGLQESTQIRTCLRFFSWPLFKEPSWGGGGGCGLKKIARGHERGQD